MSTVKGVVLKVEGREIILLTEDGEFLRRPVTGTVPRRGQKIEVTPEVEMQAGPGRVIAFPRVGLLRAAAVLVLAVLAASLLTSLPGGQPSAYIAIDINPSLELAIDANARVLSVEPLNEDARILLAGLNIVGRDLPTALPMLLDRARALKFLKPNGLVVASVVTDNGPGQPGPTLENDVRRILDAALADRGIPAQVEVVRAGLAEREQARALGLSVNKLLALRAAEARRLSLPVEQLRGAGLGDALGRAGLTVREVFAADEEEKPEEEGNDAPSAPDGDSDERNRPSGGKEDEDKEEHEEQEEPEGRVPDPLVDQDEGQDKAGGDGEAERENDDQAGPSPEDKPEDRDRPDAVEDEEGAEPADSDE